MVSAVLLTGLLAAVRFAAFFACAFLTAAHLFRCAAEILFLAAALMVCFGTAGFAFALASAHRLRCAAAILLRPAALRVRLGAGPTWAALVPCLPPSCRRISLIFSSTFRRICSKPIKAASSTDASTFLPRGIINLLLFSW